VPIYFTAPSEYGESELLSFLPLLPPKRRLAAERAKNREARLSRILGYALLLYAAPRLVPSPLLGELLLGGNGKPHTLQLHTQFMGRSLGTVCQKNEFFIRINHPVYKIGNTVQYFAPMVDDTIHITDKPFFSQYSIHI
jgi:hypothetical protein